ncbi:MAG: hypothetical protein HeimC2_42930 [Candidatus Heimdallarchaeota archaeon LC_2]|nr:MAG: hypothetical protein HeimC2_42930 [Candidatus Heimdallarchaeota archaeon LC_2]
MVETVNSSNLEYLNISNQEYHNIILGMTLYLILSFMRGFIPVTISFILGIPGVTPEFATIFGIIPMASFFLFRLVKSRFNQFLRISIIIWFLAIIIENLLFKFILILVGMYISYSLILFLLTLRLSRESISQSIIIMIFIDFSLKAVNKGNDPITSYNLNSLIFIIIITVFFSILNYVNINELKLEQITSQSTKSRENLISNLSIIAFFMGLLVYFVFFSNPGVMVLSLGISNQYIISAYLIGGTAIAFLAFSFFQKLNSNLPIFFGLCVSLFVSILFVPWEGGLFLFLIIGMFSLINLLMFNLSKMPRNISESTSTMYFVSLLFFLVFLFLIISKDGTIIPVIFTTLAVSLSLISYILSNFEEGQS